MIIGAVVGNPPYQDSISVNNRTKPIYPYFYDMSESLSMRYSLITPSRFLFNSGLTSKQWNKKMLDNAHFKVAYFNENATFVFPNTDIKGGVVISYYDKNNNFGAIKEFIPNITLRAIVGKLGNDFKKLSSIVYSGRSDLKFAKSFLDDYPQSIEDRLKAIKKRYPTASTLSKGEEFELKSSTFDILPYAFKENISIKYDYYKILGLRNGKRTHLYIKKSYMTPRYIKNNVMSYKVFVPESNGSGALGETLSSPILGFPYESTTPTFISIGDFKTEYEANNLLKYIKTKFARILLGVGKKTQHNPSTVWRYIPLQDFTLESDINWNKSISEIDEQLFEKYGLTTEEKRYILETVKEMI